MRHLPDPDRADQRRPGHVDAWAEPGTDDEFGAVCDLLLRGLSHSPGTGDL
jgi:hypothetical protein